MPETRSCSLHHKGGRKFPVRDITRIVRPCSHRIIRAGFELHLAAPKDTARLFLRHPNQFVMHRLRLAGNVLLILNFILFSVERTNEFLGCPLDSPVLIARQL